MKYVLDTNVVSALRRPGREPAVAAWVAGVPLEDLHVTAMTLAEIGLGVAAKEQTDPAQGRALRRWFEQSVLVAFGTRVLPFDRAAALVVATYRVPEHAPCDDALIAAVAQSRSMTVVTRNVAHFARWACR